jgi:hypothetical protein
MFVWNIADPAWTPDAEQYWWSITNPDGTTRPAFDALSAARAAGGSLPEGPGSGRATPIQPRAAKARGLPRVGAGHRAYFTYEQ